MATLHTLAPQDDPARNDGPSSSVVQSDLELEVLAVIRRLDEESQVGALMALQAIERRLTSQNHSVARPNPIISAPSSSADLPNSQNVQSNRDLD
jgi:hypothetical protein